MKDMRKGICELCSHNEVVMSWPLDFTYGASVPLAASHEPNHFVGPRGNKPLGVLCLCTCRKCGFSQWFVEHPEELKIGESYRTSLIVGSESGGPYR